jgi:hypothetical protein
VLKWTELKMCSRYLPGDRVTDADASLRFHIWDIYASWELPRYLDAAKRATTIRYRGAHASLGSVEFVGGLHGIAFRLT